MRIYGVALQRNYNPPFGYQGYSIFKTTNTAPLIYARRDIKEETNDGEIVDIGSDVVLFKDKIWDNAKARTWQNSSFDNFDFQYLLES